jgi:signal transduction histidine kinase
MVFAFVDESVEKRLDLPDDVTGLTTRMTFDDMLAAAHSVAPGLQHVALVGDRLDTQPAFKHLVDELPALKAQIDVIDLTGMPMVELQKRVAELPEKSVIIYTAIYSDGAGTFFTPSDGVAMIAAVANRPIVAPVETYIARGAIGGYVTVPSVIGEEAADQALQIIQGKQPSDMPIAAGTSLRPVFDWQSLHRWGVDEANMPAGSEIRNRQLPLWQQYPVQTSVVAAVVAIQSMMIAALLYEHRRRQRAEGESRARMRELAHLNRQATAGELSASIAHELNQPLGAILAHAEASEILLDTPDPDIGLIREVVGDIKRENNRASEVILRLRRLLKKAEIEKETVNLNQTVAEVFKFVEVQAADGNVELRADLSPEPLCVSADPIQLQQVVLTLVVNSIDAIRGTNCTTRRITGRTTRSGDRKAMISISDTGPGIPETSIRRVFEPFYSTKERGMGMGLSIARTIIESHGGSIRAENRDGGGAVFKIELLLKKPRGRKDSE